MHFINLLLNIFKNILLRNVIVKMDYLNRIKELEDELKKTKEELNDTKEHLKKYHAHRPNIHFRTDFWFSLMLKTFRRQIPVGTHALRC